MVEDTVIPSNKAPDMIGAVLQSSRALVEAQLMCEAINAITNDGIKNGVLEFPMLQAVRACCQRMSAAIDPAIERLQAEESHV